MLNSLKPTPATVTGDRYRLVAEALSTLSSVVKLLRPSLLRVRYAPSHLLASFILSLALTITADDISVVGEVVVVPLF